MKPEVLSRPEVVRGDGYGAYERALFDLNLRSPQRQGLLRDEFEVALVSPDVVRTNVDTEKYQLPQLTPLENYCWLNQEFYESRFPGSKIRHFLDLPGVNPGSEVLDAIHDLAVSGGVLVFDYPDVDAEYPERVEKYLANAGVEGYDFEILGTQTYFAGKIHLKEGFDPNKPILGLAEAFEGLKAKGVGSDRQNGATFYTHMDPNKACSIFPAYVEALKKLNDHPCRQGLTLEEFEEVTTENEDSAKLVFNVDGQPATICILGDDLSRYQWLNPVVYRTLYQQEYDNKQIFYFPALATDPEKQGDSNTAPVVQYICKMLAEGNNEAIIAFDCCDVNVDFLPEFIEVFVNTTPEANLNFSKIGQQKYCAVRLRPQQTDSY